MEKKDYIEHLKSGIRIQEDHLVWIKKNNSTNKSLLEASNNINTMTLNIINDILKELSRVKAPFSWGLNKNLINSLISQVKAIEVLRDNYMKSYLEHLDKSCETSLKANQATLEVLDNQLANLEYTEQKQKTMNLWDLIGELEKSIDKVRSPELMEKFEEEVDRLLEENFEYIKTFQRVNKEK